MFARSLTAIAFTLGAVDLVRLSANVPLGIIDAVIVVLMLLCCLRMLLLPARPTVAVRKSHPERR